MHSEHSEQVQRTNSHSDNNERLESVARASNARFGTAVRTEQCFIAIHQTATRSCRISSRLLMYDLGSLPSIHAWSWRCLSALKRTSPHSRI